MQGLEFRVYAGRAALNIITTCIGNAKLYRIRFMFRVFFSVAGSC
jgi:hypothetical protein